MSAVITAKLTLNDAKILASIDAADWESVQRCTVFFWQKCQEAVGVSNPWPYTAPSLPGEPPRKRTGFGQRNIVYELDRKAKTGRVGVRKNAIYMAMWEVGIRGVKRPWLLTTLARFLPQIKALAGSK